MQDREVNSYVVANTLEGSLSNYLDPSTHTHLNNCIKEP